MTISHYCAAVVLLLLSACGGKGGGGPGGSCPAGAPIAVFQWAGNAAVPARQPVVLDGSGSFSHAGAQLTYAWTIVSRPQGSAAQITGSGAMPSLLPDVAGNYAVSLVVSDTCGASAPLKLSVAAIEVAPVANAGPALVAYATPTGQILVDGSASSDANGDPLTFWWVLTPPAGSATTLVAANQPAARFTPDLEGYYRLTLTVNDGTGRSGTAAVTVGVYHPATLVPYYALDAIYSGALDRLVIVTPEPALRIVNPLDGSSTKVTLDAWPYAVSLSPDGRTAVVSQPTHFSVVDLTSAAVTTFAPRNTSWSFEGGHVVLDGRGWAYAFPSQTIAVNPLVVKLADGTVTNGSANAIAQNSIFAKPRLDATAANMFLLATNTQGMVRYSISTSGGLTYSTATSSTAQGPGPFLSQDGTRLFTGVGQIWTVSSLTATGTLLAAGETTSFTWVADSTAAGTILAVIGGVYGDDAFRRYNRSTLALMEKKFFPAVVANKQATTGTVQWAFWKPDGSGYYVVFITSGLTGVATY
jgi:hypothetical protein